MSDEPEFSWTAIADQCRRFVCAHDDPDVDATILGSILRDLRVVAGLPAVFPGDPTGIDRAARIAELRESADQIDRIVSLSADGSSVKLAWATARGIAQQLRDKANEYEAQR